MSGNTPYMDAMGMGSVLNVLITLPETNITSHLNMDVRNANFLLEWFFFGGELLVSGKVSFFSGTHFHTLVSEWTLSLNSDSESLRNYMFFDIFGPWTRNIH